MTERTDSAAEAATATPADEGEGRDPARPSPEPGSGRGEAADEPATESQRQLVETVKQIHRLEESN